MDCYGTRSAEIRYRDASEIKIEKASVARIPTAQQGLPACWPS
jgi:hypothetical protein